MAAGRLFMSELYDSYRLYFMLERKNERNNQFQHTSHPLSDGVLTAACPVYYTCKYYNAYVEICLYIEKPPLYLLTKIGSEGRVSSGASPAPELPLWSILRKFLPSVDTERRNGYNTYRVRPKRSANNSWLFHLEDNRPDYGRAVISLW